MSIKVEKIVEALGSDIFNVLGDESLEISGVAALDRAAAGQITFCKYTGEKLVSILTTLTNCAIFCSEVPKQPLQSEGPVLLLTTNPRLAFARTIEIFFPPKRPEPGIHATASVEDLSTIDAKVSIGAGCYIGKDVSIGASSIIYPNVTILGPAKIGNHVRIFSGSVIGGDGFGYERNANGELESFPHIGGVVIEDHVDIGANTCVDRGTLEDTVLRRGARIDNLVHISHNVKVGRSAAIIANAMVAGSVEIGNRAWIAPSASILNQKSVGTDATVGLAAVVLKDVPDGEVVMGIPAAPKTEYVKSQKAIKDLMLE